MTNFQGPPPDGPFARIDWAFSKLIEVLESNALLSRQQQELQARLDVVQIRLSRIWQIVGPVRIQILIDGKETPGMPISVSDAMFFVHAVGRDAGGEVVSLTDTLTWAVVDLDGITPSSAATVSEDSNHTGDSAYQLVTPGAVNATGGKPGFRLTVNDATLGLSGVSDELDPVPGAATSISVELSPN